MIWDARLYEITIYQTIDETEIGLEYNDTTLAEHFFEPGLRDYCTKTKL